MFVRTASAVALACALAAPARAAGDVEVDTQDSGTIIVTGARDRYGVEITSSATRTPTPLQDVPQAVSIVTETQIDDQALRSIADVLRYVPGATFGQGEGHRDQVTLRGNNSTADFFVDGIRDDVQYYRGLYNVERIEVLKGPNAMIFGRGGGGGIINRVLKRPAAGSFTRATGSIDSEGGYLIDADLNHAFSEAAAGRLNAVYERFDTHRRFYEGERYALNPTFALSIGGLTRIDLSYEYDRDDRVVDRGIPSAGPGTIAEPARPLRGFRDAFFGDPEVNRSEFDAHVLRGRVEHQLSDSLTLTSRLLYGDYDKAYQNVFAATAVSTNAATGARTVGIEAYRDPTQRENLFGQTDLVWEVATGPLSHVLLGGFEIGTQDTRNERINGFFVGVPTTSSGRRTVVPVSDPLTVPSVEFRAGPAGAGNRAVETDADVLAFYLQDQVSIGPMFDLIAGIRYDRFQLAVTNLFNNQSFRRTDDLWSPRLGLVFKPVEPVSIYASYSRSYLPQSGDQFLSLDITSATLEPEKFDNYELGLKWAIRPALLFTAALYQLDRTNTRAPLSGGVIVLSGEQRSRGLELQVAGEISRNWHLNAGYALQDAEIRSATTACTSGSCDVPQVPKHQASLWTRYDVSKRIGFGLGAHHQSRSFASITNAVVLPAYTRLDAAVYFRITPQVQAQLNVENLLGERYFATAHNDNNITPGAPTTVRGTLRFNF
ncbi:MAG TPA: TonB-dependent siderophore receptor [Allosphingosinicella sp.]|jgi:catecholate siderophore receptor|uniref:TonB-dependent receptor n=1 Tax=Allosphingosinicella sp. TaxID=2823234 RepID=UPI002F295585